MKLNHISISHAPDDRFSRLVGAKKWQTLPQAVRKRFGKRLKGGVSVAYQGKVTSMRMNLAGRIIAHAARIIGAPLPYDMSCVDQPAVVTVTEDIAGSGQFWIRQYGRKAGFPQVVHSSKRFAGPTGLEEYIGYGIGMALNVCVQGQDLLFKSDHYFVQVFGRRVRLPRVLNPGALVIGHHDMGDGQFRFSLDLKHRLLGQMIYQDALFNDAKE
ncbi:protein of unknown function [Octadecabacter temperatus]|uniref:Uncharacterized protein n=1 Tax=Octadecabacter temperatus TaxID=1458307 RepID=A0A0K0Y2Q7_9RHOB|nr:DUF4166 domain-containing protein [Octadecabacter temperatus]AKS45202.1 hypothetical protein OSB_06410 [Octadecabacter temperatus]SIN88186.1 protein of unknown function [Octadecabacter temperatus]